MSALPWVRFFPSDWLAGTRGMSAAETGVYISLISMMYERNEPISEDPARLARLCGASNSQFKKALDSLLSEGKIIRVDGGLWNGRVEKERVFRGEKTLAASQAGKASGRARSDKNAELRRLRMVAAREKGVHTAIEWGALFSACGARCVACGSEEGCEKDHIVPVYQGGSDGIENLQPLCRSCNAGKGADSNDLRPENWRRSYEAVMSSLNGKTQQKQRKTGTDVQHFFNGRSTNQKPEPDLEKETLSRVSKKTEPKIDERVIVLSEVLDEEHAVALNDHRKLKSAKSWTPRAAAMMVKELAKGRGLGIDPNEASEAIIRNGWTGFEVDWILRNRRAALRVVQGQAPPGQRPPTQGERIRAKLNGDMFDEPEHPNTIDGDFRRHAAH